MISVKLPPEAGKLGRAEFGIFGIFDGVLNDPMAEIVLNCPRVVAGVG